MSDGAVFFIGWRIWAGTQPPFVNAIPEPHRSYDKLFKAAEDKSGKGKKAVPAPDLGEATSDVSGARQFEDDFM